LIISNANLLIYSNVEANRRGCEKGTFNMMTEKKWQNVFSSRLCLTNNAIRDTYVTCLPTGSIFSCFCFFLFRCKTAASKQILLYRYSNQALKHFSTLSTRPCSSNHSMISLPRMSHYMRCSLLKAIKPSWL
jgi:hypothetical protein